MKKPRILAPMIVLIALVLAPVLIGWWQTPDEQVFGGFVFNPMDGNTYLAKMQQGWGGSWQFVLPYTAEQSRGAFLFVYYLFLGHLARMLHLPLIVVFHLARLAGAALLALALRDFLMVVFPSKPGAVRRGLWLALFGGGLGWLAPLAGVFTADLWVAEGFPFLSSFANPHFPLGMALLLWILARFAQPPRGGWREWLELSGLGMLLALVMPFGVVTAAVVSGCATLWALLVRQGWAALGRLTALAGGGLYLVYQYIVILRDPILAGWNAQNVTLSPSVLNTLASFSPAIVLAGVSIAVLLRQGDLRESWALRLLTAWLVLGGLLIYVPFDLQRRFMFAYDLPAAALAVTALEVLPVLRARAGLRRWTYALLLALSLPSMLIVWMTGFYAGKSSPAEVYYSRDEARAMEWIAANTPQDALVLASPEMGLFIPARTGRRVIYGHPFETAEAMLARSWLDQFLRGDGATIQLTRLDVDILFYGPRERAIGRPALLDSLQVVFQAGDVMLYAVEQLR